MTEKDYKPRLSAPEKGNKYYIRKANGGYSPCIQGKPTTLGTNALANCVGYATGRFNEIGDYKECKYLGNTDAENFVTLARKQGLTITQEPTLGGCMVWAKGKVGDSKDGAGHVAIVEAINADGSVTTSDSGYNSISFYTKKRSGSNWGQSPQYTYLCCIRNPAIIPQTVYRVQTGAFLNRANAEKYADDLREKGIPCFVVEGVL